MTDYWLGIDLGTTYTAAAVSRPNGTTEMLGLGTRSLMIPSVVLVRDDGEILVGEAADRRAATEPSRVARDFKRRLGDPSPLFLGGTPFSAEALMAHVLRYVMERAREREGGSPTGTVITHPASWSPFKIDLLRDAVRQASIDGAVLMTEPEAAALHYGGLQRVSPGETVAVYDFGGGTFDSAVLMASDGGFSLAGTPEGIERLGGIDFDQAILSHVNGALGGALSELDPADPTDSAALAELRDSCRAAKEALSEDTDATITVNLPGRPSTQLRITRSEFEELISPRIDDTIDVLERTIVSAGRATGDITRILPVGGSSRIPLVHQRIREATGRPLSFDTDPNLAIAQGAAALARQVSANADALAAPSPTAAYSTVAAATVAASTAGAAGVAGATAFAAPATGAPTPPPPAPSGRRPVLIGAGVVGAIAVIALATTVLLGGDDVDDPAAADVTTTVASEAPSPSSSTGADKTTTTAAPGATASADSETFTGADGRSTQFGGITYEIEHITSAGDVVTVDLVATNVTDSGLRIMTAPMLRLADDPVELAGVAASGSPAGLEITASAAQRVSYAFTLPSGSSGTATLSGAALIFQDDDAMRAGIPLDDTAPEPPTVAATPVGATVSIEGHSYGQLTVVSILPSLDATTSVDAGGGDNDPVDFRAAKDGVWLRLALKLDCRGGSYGQDCRFGLDEDVIRIEVDGVATGFEGTRDSTLFDLATAMAPGSSADVTPQMMVKRGTTYALLLGDPGDPAAVQRVPLDLGPTIATLVDSVADFQTT